MHQSARHPTVLPGIEAISIISDRTFPRHSHDEFGIGVLLDGAQDSWSGRGLVEAQAGDVITVNPGELHDGIGRPDRTRHWRMLFFSPAAMAEVLDSPVTGFEMEHPVIRKGNARLAVETAIAAVSSNHPDRDQIEEALLFAVHSASARSERLDQRAPRSLTPCVARVIDRIKAEADLSLSLADFAATAGLSRFQILRRFADEVGTTPHSYLTQHRVKLARRAIAAGSPLADAAVSSGFADQSHMTRAFSRQIGISPGRYRSG
ncbi:MAG: AraC family transcriptional regulator [Rhodobacteraceae bacterium]|nr:AraC family transcriptional regulator [Paracoccaceae bacterium]